MIFEIGLISVVAAHEQADAIVNAGKNQLRLAGAQAFGAAAAKRVAQQDGVVAAVVCRVDALLEVRAHADAKIVQAHGHVLHLDRVGRTGDNVARSLA